MANTIVVGEGIRARKHVRYDFAQDHVNADMQAALTMMLGWKSLDERLDERAQEVRQILVSMGLPDPETHAGRLHLYEENGKGAPQYILAKWYFIYLRLVEFWKQMLSDGTPQMLSDLAATAIELGELQGREELANTRDPKTGNFWEVLALRGQAQTKHAINGRKMKSDTSFAARRGKAAQARACELYEERPSRTWTWICQKLIEEENVSLSTLKRVLKNPKKLGSSRHE